MTKTRSEPLRAPSDQEGLPLSVRLVVEAAQDKKARDVVVLDLRRSDAFTDFFIVCSGRTDRQVRAIVDEIHKRLRDAGQRPTHVEGYENAEWVLLDCFDFVVHVFTEEARRFYDLERLWGSATRVVVAEPQAPGAPDADAP